MLLGINKDKPELHDVYRLDLATGELEKVLENPGFVGWLADTDLAVQGAASVTEEGGAVFYLADENGEFHPWLEVSAGGREHHEPDRVLPRRQHALPRVIARRERGPAGRASTWPPATRPCSPKTRRTTWAASRSIRRRGRHRR